MDYEENQEFLKLVSDILNSDKFNKLKDIEHHGTTRYNHSVKVSYRAYKISKLFKLDYESVARAGLLHDFFLSKIGRSFKTRFISTFTHPKKASKNAEMFGINEKQKNMIESHMFPFCLTMPVYLESWIVVFSDKTIGLKEFILNWKKNLKYVTNFTFLIFLSLIK